MHIHAKEIFFLLFLLVVLATPTLLHADSILDYDIQYHSSTEVGESIVVTFKDRISEVQALESFEISPNIYGSLQWVGEYNELHFLPYEGFESGTTYTVNVGIPTSLLALANGTPGSYVYTATLPLVTPSPVPVLPSALEPSVTRGKFIDINLYTMAVTLYDDGRQIDSFTVAGKGDPNRGSTREGIFTVRTKEENHFSSLSHVDMPWSMQYSGDFFVHEWPLWPNGDKIESKYSAGCVRFFPGDAKRIFDFAKIGTPLKVHTTYVETHVNPATVQSDDLVREMNSNQNYLVRFENGKEYKREVGSELSDWYGYYEPFFGTTKIIPDGRLEDMKISRFLEHVDANGFFKGLYWISEKGEKKKVPCTFESECDSLLSLSGYNYDYVFKANNREMDAYIVDTPFEIDESLPRM